jgi:hypothetical protein
MRYFICSAIFSHDARRRRTRATRAASVSLAQTSREKKSVSVSRRETPTWRTRDLFRMIAWSGGFFFGRGDSPEKTRQDASENSEVRDSSIRRFSRLEPPNFPMRAFAF